MKKIKLNALTLFISATALFISCSSDSTQPNFQFPTVSNSGSKVKQIIHSGNLPETYDYSFTYSAQSIGGVTATYKSGTTTEKANTLALVYSPAGLSVRSSDQVNPSIELNSDKLISRITIGGNTYNYSYSEGRLIGWTEQITESGYTGTLRVSRGTLAYDSKGDLYQLIYVRDEEYPLYTRTFTFTPSTRSNVNGLIPEVVAREMGILGFEYLYYAGGFGKPTTNLVSSISAVYALEETKNYTLTFDYTFDPQNGDVIMCSYPYGGQYASVTYKY